MPSFNLGTCMKVSIYMQAKKDYNKKSTYHILSNLDVNQDFVNPL